MSLKENEIKQALELFVECQAELFSGLSETDQATLDTWVQTVVLINPAVMFRPDAVFEINERIFDNQVISGFVLDLAFHFFAKAGGPEFSHALCVNLAHALLLDGPEPDNSTIPTGVKLSMPQTLFGTNTNFGMFSKILRFLKGNNALTIFEFLENNKHLVIVLLVHLTNSTSTTL